MPLWIASGVPGVGDLVQRLVGEAHRLALGQSLNRLSMEERHALEIQQQLRTATHILVHQESPIHRKFVQHLPTYYSLNSMSQFCD